MDKTLLLFSSPTCAPCKELALNLDAAGLPYTKVDVTEEANYHLVQRFRIRGGLPVVIITKDDCYEAMLVGLNPIEAYKRLWADT